jgi:hypothetical protein
VAPSDKECPNDIGNFSASTSSERLVLLWLRCQLCYRGGERRGVAVEAARTREEIKAERGGALYVVAITLFLLAAYITCQGISSLLSED